MEENPMPLFINWLLILLASLFGLALAMAAPVPISAFYLLIILSSLLWLVFISPYTDRRSRKGRRTADRALAIGLLLFLLLSYRLPWAVSLLPSFFFSRVTPPFWWGGLALLAVFPLRLHPVYALYWLFLFLAAVWSRKAADDSIRNRRNYLSTKDRYESQLRQLQEVHQQSQVKSLADQRTAILEERNRIAREIHDTVGHQLTQAILQTAALESLQPDNPMLTRLHQSLDQAMTNIRQSVHAIHDQSLTLENQLEQLASHYSFCPVHLDIELQEEPPVPLYYLVVMAATEALQNTARHSDASRFDLTLRQQGDQLILMLWDNGSLKEETTDSKGMGLLSMEDRVISLGGRIHINQENGFHIFIQLPYKKERAVPGRAAAKERRGE